MKYGTENNYIVNVHTTANNARKQYATNKPENKYTV